MYSTYWTPKPRQTRNSAADGLLSHLTFTDADLATKPELRKLVRSHLGWPEGHDKPPKGWFESKTDTRKYFEPPSQPKSRKRKRQSSAASATASETDWEGDYNSSQRETLPRDLSHYAAFFDPPATKGVDIVRNIACHAEEALSDWITAESLVGQPIARTHYECHFKDPRYPEAEPEEWDPWPVVQLQLPALDYVERYPLVKPANFQAALEPIAELLSIIKLTLDYYLTPEQAFEHFCYRHHSGTQDKSFEEHDDDYTRKLNDAAEAADGPAFLALVDRFNLVIEKLKKDGTIRQNIENMRGVPEELWTKISFQAYERTVGPRVSELKNYKAFSDQVYGELLPPFMYDIIHQTDLKPGKTFIDLGCGVGNCLIQVGLATGCKTFGVEMQKGPATLGLLQLEEAQKRWKLFGLQGGVSEMKQADFLLDPEVPERLASADVILVNNYAFSANTNRSLLALFLDLPDGALVVSLKPFTHRKTRLHSIRTKLGSNRDSIQSEIDLILRPYRKLRFSSDSVSWMPKGGDYYIAQIQRRKMAPVSTTTNSTVCSDSSLTELSSDSDDDSLSSDSGYEDQPSTGPSEGSQGRSTEPSKIIGSTPVEDLSDALPPSQFIKAEPEGCPPKVATPILDPHETTQIDAPPTI